LIGAVKLIKFDWYLGGIKHLTVKDSLRKKGHGKQLIEMAEKAAITQNIRVLQATIRRNDIASIKCFKRKGYKEVNCFFNKRTHRDILIFQKILSPCE
jgi:ribosomal protein S18 acetylase RimI-like enzyme